jgi:hypothetical protein
MEFEQVRFLVSGAARRHLSRVHLNKPGSITGNRMAETLTKRSPRAHARCGDRLSLKGFLRGRTMILISAQRPFQRAEGVDIDEKVGVLRPSIASALQARIFRSLPHGDRSIADMNRTEAFL